MFYQGRSSTQLVVSTIIIAVAVGIGTITGIEGCTSTNIISLG